MSQANANSGPAGPGTPSLLAQMLLAQSQTDTLGDAAFDALRARGLPPTVAAARVRSLAVGCPALRALVDDMEAVPTWVDFACMRKGGAMAQRNHPMLILALTYGALPLVFAHPSSAAVFRFTGHFAAHIPRRLNQSAALFFGVTRSDELRPGAPMWQACVHVRLIHAAVRAALRNDLRFDTLRHGVPISQLQTAAGPAFFGTHLLAGMRALGAEMSGAEAAGHQMTWRYVTRLLGVPEPLVAPDQARQDALDAQLLHYAVAPGAEGQQMVATLLSGLRSVPGLGRLAPDAHAALMRVCLGEPWARAFGVPQGDPNRIASLRAGLRAYARAVRPAPAGAVATWTGRHVLRWLAREGLMRDAIVHGPPDNHRALPRA